MTTFLCAACVPAAMEPSLRDFGLTPTEEKLYLALLRLGSSAPTALVRETGSHKATVYAVLERLLQKGFVSFIVKGRTRHFQAADPGFLLELVERERKENTAREGSAQALVAQLRALASAPATMEQAYVLRGKRAVRNLLEEILKQGSYDCFSSQGKFHDVFGPYFYQFEQRKREMGLKSRILFDESLRGKPFLGHVHGNIRFIPKEYASPITTMIFGKKLAMIVWSENPTAFVLESPEVVSSYRRYFEYVWRRAR